MCDAIRLTASVARVRDELLILVKGSLGDGRRSRRPCRLSSSHLLIGDINGKCVLDSVDVNHVTILHQSDRSSNLSFGNHMANDETV